MATADMIGAGATYAPETNLRQTNVDLRQAAVIFIDVQNYNCHKGGAMYRRCTPEKLEGPEFAYWWSRINECTTKWAQLQQAARAYNIEVIYTVIQSLTADGRERSLDYKISGFHVPPGCWDAKVIDAITPGPDELVLPKTSSSVFNSTMIDYILRNMDKRFLIMAGCVTDHCVAHAVKDAADLGYLVTLVTDCCATYSEERHEQACRMVDGYCRQRTLDALLEELMGVAAKSNMLLGITGSGPPGEPPGDGGPGGLDGGLDPGHDPGLMGGGAGSAGYGGGSANAGLAGLDVGGGLGGSGGAGGYKRAYSAMMGQEHGNHYSGDNFSPGLGGDPSEEQDYDDDDDGQGRSGGLGGTDGRSRGGTGGTSRRQSSRGRSRTFGSGGGDSSKKVYFEYAKIQWESEREFMLPNGSSWVDVAVRGDPGRQERGLVFCRLCRHYNKNNVFGKGYRAGKRSALKEHMQTKDHKELVEALDAGHIMMPSYSSMPMQPPVPGSHSPPTAAAAAAADHRRSRGQPESGDYQQAFDPAAAAAATRGFYPPDPAAAAALYLEQQQQYSAGQQYDQQQRHEPTPLGYPSSRSPAPAAAAADPLAAAATLCNLQMTATSAAAAAAAMSYGSGSEMPPPPPMHQQYGMPPPHYGGAAAVPGGRQQYFGHGGNGRDPAVAAAPAAVPKGVEIGDGTSDVGILSIDQGQLAGVVARVASAAGLSPDGLLQLVSTMQGPSSQMTDQEAAAAFSAALRQAAAAARLDAGQLNDLLAGMTAPATAAADIPQQQQQQQHVYDPQDSSMMGPPAAAAAGKPGQQQQQQQVMPQEQQQQI